MLTDLRERGRLGRRERNIHRLPPTPAPTRGQPATFRGGADAPTHRTTRPGQSKELLLRQQWTENETLKKTPQLIFKRQEKKLRRNRNQAPSWKCKPKHVNKSIKLSKYSNEQQGLSHKIEKKAGLHQGHRQETHLNNTAQQRERGAPQAPGRNWGPVSTRSRQGPP